MPCAADIRQQFIDYFVDRHAHTFVPSSPVVPHGDPTLLFANAGMNQFKDVFLDTGTREYTRAVNTQKCIRAGGKHNNLDDVGRDTYHHTFFKMLGNWSFGDYFKAEAIEWAWDLLTNVWGLPKDRLYATVFGGDEADGLEPDGEAASLWAKVTDINPAHISKWDKKDNFWEMGDTGPCGPCSEIHIDLTPDGSGAALVNRNDPRVIELWNLVFIQFNRDTTGALHPLPAKHVDTGMGFERVATVLQGKSSNYDTDVFTPLFDAIREVTDAREYGGELDDPVDMAYRVIADHVRMATFAITDGAMPGANKADAVLRSVIRRAARHGWQTFDVHEPFLYRLVDTVASNMGDAFPELKKNPGHVADVIREEEEAFDRTLERGIALFTAACGFAEKQISANDAFNLHDTYGFPLDLTQVMAQERGMTVDVEGFNKRMDEARQIARAGAGGDPDVHATLIDIMQKEQLPGTEFLGYETISCTETTTCRHFDLGDTTAVVTGKTPFYAESGGQVGDHGTITCDDGTLHVTDTQKVGHIVFHLGRLDGELPDTDAASLTFTVDGLRRRPTMANHTATHMLNRALRNKVNPDADQKGSLVDDHHLRFDFSNSAAVSMDHLEAVERMVNADIAADLPVYWGYAPLEEANQINGLRAVFGEKYPPSVRVVSIGVPTKKLLADPDNDQWPNHSIEFCGGTHLAKTGDAGGFVVLSEEAVAKGVRRITAVTGNRAHDAQANADRIMSKLNALSDAAGDDLQSGVAEVTRELAETPVPAIAAAKMRQSLTALQKKVKNQRKQQDKQAAGDIIEVARDLADTAEQPNGGPIVAFVPGADARTLRTAMDVIKKKRPDTPMLLAAVTGDKLAFLASVPDEAVKRGLKAGDWVKQVAQATGGNGGGRPDMAQAGGKDVDKLDEALEVAKQFAASRT